ncbi:xanthine dehydrogenase family protein molybdopterin-binding subunit, partial [Sphingobium yanoikuyae]|nr:xanthine dehydrogenase family protein molybdopterin-binding subunit [Sphingobium yanoikuyae]
DAPAPAAPPAPTVAPAAPVGIDGAWKLVLATPMGPQPMVAHFQVSGDRVTGRLEADQGSQEFVGTIAGNQVAWEMKVTKPMAITLKYALMFDGDSVTGKCKMGIFGTAKVRGERA